MPTEQKTFAFEDAYRARKISLPLRVMAPRYNRKHVLPTNINYF
jgi:hypothetical protein